MSTTETVESPEVKETKDAKESDYIDLIIERIKSNLGGSPWGDAAESLVQLGLSMFDAKTKKSIYLFRNVNGIVLTKLKIKRISTPSEATPSVQTYIGNVEYISYTDYKRGIVTITEPQYHVSVEDLKECILKVLIQANDIHKCTSCENIIDTKDSNCLQCLIKFAMAQLDDKLIDCSICFVKKHRIFYPVLECEGGSKHRTMCDSCVSVCKKHDLHDVLFAKRNGNTLERITTLIPHRVF